MKVSAPVAALLLACREHVTTQRLRVAVALAATAAALCILFNAPWAWHDGGETRDHGRASVFSRGPVGRNPTYPYLYASKYCIATGELAVELGAVFAIAGLLLLVIPKPR